MPRRQNPNQRLRGLANNKQRLLEFVGYNSIKRFRRDNPEFTTVDSAYKSILGLYNHQVDTLNQQHHQQEIARRKVQRAEQRRNQVFNYDYEVKYKYKFNNDTEWRNGTKAIQFSSRQNERNAEAQRLFEGVRDFVENEYDFESKDFKLVLMKTHKIVLAGGKIVHTNIRIARMREARAYQLDKNYLGVSTWDRGVGTCVFDYIYETYKNTEGLTKLLKGTKTKPLSREQAYEELQKIFTSIEFLGEEEVVIKRKPLIEGVCSYEILEFCKQYDIAMYALDKGEKVILTHKQEKKDNHKKPMIFIIANNHFYPVEDKFKRLSVSAKVREDNRPDEEKVFWKSTDIEYEVSNEKQFDNIVYPDTENINPNEWAVAIFKEKNKLPDHRKVRIDDSYRITSFELENTLYITERPQEAILTTHDNYKGETPLSLLNQIYQEIYEHRIWEDPNIVSSFNTEVYDSLAVKGVKFRTHYGTIPSQYTIEGLKDLPKERFTTIDINKCYSSCLKDPYDDWLQFDIGCIITDFDGVMKSGLYFVETEDLTLLHQSNWYSSKIVLKAMKEGIPLQITHQLLPSKTIPKEYFHRFIDAIIEKYGLNTSMMKLILNAITGYLGKTDAKKFVVNLDTDPEDIWRYFYECNETENEKYFYQDWFKEKNYNRFGLPNIFIKQIADDINMFGFVKKEKNADLTLPLYIQILDYANMRLYDLMKKVGGTPVYRKTDLVVCVDGVVPELSKEWGGYKEENHYEPNWISVMNQDRTIPTPIINNSWKQYSHNDSNEAIEICKVADKQGGLLLCGRAGTGKTRVIKEAFATGLWKLDEDTITMSFTNKASRNCEGTTIHKTLKLSKVNKVCKKTFDGLRKYKRIVIDEIGMIPTYIWKILLALKRSTKIVFILLGDHRQLKPIEEEGVINTDIFNHPVVKELCNNNRIELTQRKRYDLPLWNYLEDFYERGIIGTLQQKKLFADEIYHSRNICYFNKTRDRINDMCMDYFKSQTNYLHIPYERKQGKDRFKSVYIYVDLPVMAIVANNKHNIINSDEFYVSNFDDETIELRREEKDETIIIEKDDFHKYFVCNYCITTHKAQGSTFPGQLNIFDFEYIMKDRNAGYTALSRATALDKIVVAR